MSSTLKEVLFQQCVSYVRNRVHSIQDSISSSQESANSEEKSTAGDKHDTARAMMQLEVEQKSQQLIEAQKLNIGLSQIKPNLKLATVQLGALVTTNNGIYYIAISLGKVVLNDQTYFVISPSSPIGQALFGLKKGDATTFNGKKIVVEEVE